MIRSDNLRSAFTQEDVDTYIYDLLPKPRLCGERDRKRTRQKIAYNHRAAVLGC